MCNLRAAENREHSAKSKPGCVDMPYQGTPKADTEMRPYVQVIS